MKHENIRKYCNVCKLCEYACDKGWIRRLNEYPGCVHIPKKVLLQNYRNLVYRSRATIKLFDLEPVAVYKLLLCLKR